MKRILMLPLLTIPSGHHHVADALQDELEKNGQYECVKEELLSRTFGFGEHLVSSVYLKWIQVSPSFYSSIYKRISKPQTDGFSKYPIYEHMFTTAIRRILQEHEPDMVVCTHALPSYLLDVLKQNEEVKVPIINVYTDYFINGLWGRKLVDGHIIPDYPFKRMLMDNGVGADRIHVLGMPVHRSISPGSRRTFLKKKPYQVLVSGGNLGTGKLHNFLAQIQAKGRIHYQVLCGKNQKLYDRVFQLQNKWIEPLPYIDSREDMNRLYEQCDAIITKPGGVTIAESLRKRIPIFVYDHLPGQEEYNFVYLRDEGLILPLTKWENTEPELLKRLDDEQQFERIQSRIEKFSNRLERDSAVDRILMILKNGV